MRVACGSSGGLSGPWVVSGSCCPDRFVPGPTRVWPGRGSGRCGGLCRSVVLLGPGPRSVCRPVRVRPLPANLRPKIATARKSLRIAHRVRQAARKRS